VITVVPGATIVTLPLEVTVATLELLEAKVNAPLLVDTGTGALKAEPPATRSVNENAPYTGVAFATTSVDTEYADEYLLV
jgi:hypothetical protein